MEPVEKDLKYRSQSRWLPRPVRKILAGISIVLIIPCGIVIPFVFLAFAAVWLKYGLPIFIFLWLDQANLRLSLALIFLILAVGLVAGGFAGVKFWIRFVRHESLAREEDMWPFGRGQWSRYWELPSTPNNFSVSRSNRRIRGAFLFLWLGFWALLGSSLAPASVIPLGIWFVGGTPALRSVWIRLSTPDAVSADFWIVIISLLFGFLTGTPVAVFLLRRFLKGVLRLSDEEVKALFERGRRETRRREG